MTDPKCFYCVAEQRREQKYEWTNLNQAVPVTIYQGTPVCSMHAVVILNERELDKSTIDELCGLAKEK